MLENYGNAFNNYLHSAKTILIFEVVSMIINLWECNFQVSQPFRQMEQTRTESFEPEIIVRLFSETTSEVN